MIAATADFVCAADEVWRLQRGSDAECVLFQRMVTGGERITDRGSRQGTWVFAPGGAVLARTGAGNAERVLATLAKGLAAWRELDDSQRRVPADAGLASFHRWERSFPEDGLVLEWIVRDLRGDPQSGELAGGRWNRDSAWFSREEVARLVPADVAVGDVLSLGTLGTRLARFHLVDNARGQTLPYAAEEIQLSQLDARIVARRADVVDLELSGDTVAVAEGPWLLGHNLWKPGNELPHGIRCRIAGKAVYDLERRSFVALELVAVGAHQGRTQMNGRGRDASPGLVAFHARIAPDGLRVAPTFVAVYDADWIVPPDVPTWLSDPAECGLEGR